MKEKELSISDLIKKLNRLSVIDVMYGETYSNVYMTHVTKYFNKEKLYYIYFTDLIHNFDFNKILDYIDQHSAFNDEILNQINDLINASTIKFCLTESLGCSIVHVSVKIGSKWAKYLSNEPVSGEKLYSIKESKNVLMQYDYKLDYNRTFQQCKSHIERLERSVQMLVDLEELIEILDYSVKSKLDKSVLLSSSEQKQELIQIIKEL